MCSFSGSRSPVGLQPRRAPDRLAALLTAFRLVYRVLPPSGFHGWHVCQQSGTVGIEPTCVDITHRFARLATIPVYRPILTGTRLFRCHQFRSYGSPALHSAADFKRTQTHGSAPPFARRVGSRYLANRFPVCRECIMHRLSNRF